MVVLFYVLILITAMGPISRPTNRAGTDHAPLVLHGRMDRSRYGRNKPRFLRRNIPFGHSCRNGELFCRCKEVLFHTFTLLIGEIETQAKAQGLLLDKDNLEDTV